MTLKEAKGVDAVFDPVAEILPHLQEGMQLAGTDGGHLGAAVFITARWGQSPIARSIMALISAGIGSPAQPNRHVAMIGKSKKVQKVMPDGLSWINTSRGDAASRMPLSPRA